MQLLDWRLPTVFCYGTLGLMHTHKYSLKGIPGCTTQKYFNYLDTTSRRGKSNNSLSLGLRGRTERQKFQEGSDQLNSDPSSNSAKEAYFYCAVPQLATVAFFVVQSGLGVKEKVRGSMLFLEHICTLQYKIM